MISYHIRTEIIVFSCYNTYIIVVLFSKIDSTSKKLLTTKNIQIHPYIQIPKITKTRQQ